MTTFLKMTISLNFPWRFRTFDQPTHGVAIWCKPDISLKELQKARKWLSQGVQTSSERIHLIPDHSASIMETWTLLLVLHVNCKGIRANRYLRMDQIVYDIFQGFNDHHGASRSRQKVYLLCFNFARRNSSSQFHQIHFINSYKELMSSKFTQNRWFHAK